MYHLGLMANGLWLNQELLWHWLWLWVWVYLALWLWLWVSLLSLPPLRTPTDRPTDQANRFPLRAYLFCSLWHAPSSSTCIHLSRCQLLDLFDFCHFAEGKHYDITSIPTRVSVD
jgi:hypothetical protein